MSEQILQQDSEMASVANASATAIDCSNADMVDGMHAAEFAKDSLALQYRGGVPDEADVNNHQKNGFYWTGSNPTNKPNGSGTIANSFIENDRYGTRMFTSIDEGGNLYFQTTKDYKKGEWHEVYHSGNLGTSKALQYRGVIADGTDVNAYQENGFYWTGSNPTNKPGGSGTIANNFIENGRYGTRTFTSIDEGGKLFFQIIRDYNKGEWREVYHTGNLNPANFATAAQGVKADSAMQPSRIKVQAAQPTDPQEGDIWIKS